MKLHEIIARKRWGNKYNGNLPPFRIFVYDRVKTSKLFPKIINNLNSENTNAII